MFVLNREFSYLKHTYENDYTDVQSGVYFRLKILPEGISNHYSKLDQLMENKAYEFSYSKAFVVISFILLSKEQSIKMPLEVLNVKDTKTHITKYVLRPEILNVDVAISLDMSIVFTLNVDFSHFFSSVEKLLSLPENK
jgi:hypothetical protein